MNKDDELNEDDYENWKCPISDEELERRSKAGGGRTLKEILDDLEGMSKGIR